MHHSRSGEIAADNEHPAYAGQIVAHRGRSAGGPENVPDGMATLPSWVAGVEVDVRLSSDGVAVLMHDATVDRVTDGAGAVSEMSYQNISRLIGPGGASIPTLQEYLAACEGRGFETILVDVKAPDEATMLEVSRVVADSPVEKSCVLMVRESKELRAFRKLGRWLRLGCFQTSVSNVDKRLDNAARLDVELLMLKHGDSRYLRHREAVAQIHKDGVRAGASTVNSDEALEAAVADECDVILTDSAEKLGKLYATGA